MRIALALLVALLMTAPALGESSDLAPMHEECTEGPTHDECHKESPGVGLFASLSVLGALAFVARRRLA